jgi:hypothetical protein
MAMHFVSPPHEFDSESALSRYHLPYCIAIPGELRKLIQKDIVCNMHSAREVTSVVQICLAMNWYKVLVLQ